MASERMALDTVVVAGASLGGLNAVEGLRAEGYDGRIVVVGAEPHLPYDRPPLSKQVLAGEWDADRAALRPAERYDELDVDWELGRRVVELDLGSRECRLDDDRLLAFDGFVVATGATPRLLPGTPDLDGIFVLRTLDDSLALRAAFDRQPSRVVVVGAGFIGSEVAATARGRGLDVTVLEALPVPLAGPLGEEMGAAVSALHGDHGVELRCGVGVEGLDGDGGRVAGVRLADGSSVEADVVVVGVGVAPETGWLEGSGLTIDNGLVCDEACLAAEGIVAAGDVCRWPNPLFGEVMRVEHWDNAIQQGRHAAQTLLRGDAAEPFAPVPWFWSDQYDVKIQFAGRRGDRVEVVEGSVDERRFVAVYGRDDRVVGVLGIGRPRQVMQYRMRLAEGLTWADRLDVLDGP